MAEVTVRDFGVQFKEAIDFLKSKVPEGTLSHDALAGPVHAKVFAISGATSISFLSDIQKSLVSAAENGTTLSQFRKDWDAAVQKHGWTYKGKRGWRTALIFNTNMRSAHMKGRWDQLLANSDRRPYLQYRTAGDSRVRPQHRQWNGLIFPIGDPFWPTHYPPNGLNCRCTVRAYSESDLTALGVKPSPPFELKTRTVVSRDGEIKDQVPVGIDPGWDHNVGQSWIAPELALGQKLAALPRYLQGVFVDKTISPAFQKVMNTNFKGFRNSIKPGDGASQIAGFFDSATVNAVAAKLPEVPLKSVAAAVFDRKVIATGQAWPDDWLDSLPENFRNYRAVLWDKIEEKLVLVPQGSFNKLLPTIHVTWNQSTNVGSAAAIDQLSATTPGALKNTTRYDLLVGSLGD